MRGMGPIHGIGAYLTPEYTAILIVLGLLTVYVELCLRSECSRKFDDWIGDLLTLRIFRKF